MMYSVQDILRGINTLPEAHSSGQVHLAQTSEFIYLRFVSSSIATKNGTRFIWNLDGNGHLKNWEN